MPIDGPAALPRRPLRPWARRRDTSPVVHGAHRSRGYPLLSNRGKRSDLAVFNVDLYVFPSHVVEEFG
jgi:hypothetical protein